MIRFGPSVREERAIAMNLPVPWRRKSIFVSVVFFVLTTVLLAAIFLLCAELELPKGWITAIVAIGMAEVLIQRLRFFGTGIESALWVGGLFAFLFGLPSQGKPEALLAFAAAAAIAGLRMRNALFGLLGVTLVITYLSPIATDGPAYPTALACTLGAALALMRTWQRPSTDMLFASIVLVMPIAAYMARKNDVGDWHTDIAVVIVFAALAAILSALAMRTRDRILLAAAAVSTAIAAVEAHDWFSLAIEWKLILSGAAIVGAAAILSRILTKRTAGFVVTPHALTRYDELIQIAGTLAIATPAQSVAGPSHEGGGKFGGAGATAEY